MVLFFVGVLIIYTGLKTMVDAGKTLPTEFIERQRQTKMTSPLMFAIYPLPYVGAYLLYENLPRFAWQIIFVVLAIAVIELLVWYYLSIKKLNHEGFPQSYISKMRHGYSLFGLGAVTMVAANTLALFA